MSRKYLGYALVAALSLISTLGASNQAKAQSWTHIHGRAHEISVGANGAVWAIGTDPAPGGFGIWRFNGVSWDRLPAPHAAVKIAVAPNGLPWVVNSYGNIFYYDGATFRMVPGLVREISVGADGSVWIIGADSQPGGYGIYRWNGSNWDRLPAPHAAVKIAVAPNGLPWVVNSYGNIFYHDGQTFRMIEGQAREISVAVDGTVYVVGMDQLPYGFALYRLRSHGWERLEGHVTRIAAVSFGSAWAINRDLNIYRTP